MTSRFRWLGLAAVPIAALGIATGAVFAQSGDDETPTEDAVEESTPATPEDTADEATPGTDDDSTDDESTDEGATPGDREGCDKDGDGTPDTDDTSTGL